METVDLSRLKEGRRLLCEDHFGTIRYVGEVPPTQGVWLGVEWDEPERGKHSGTHEGKQYFTCSVTDSGSFIRPKKAITGTTFLQALEERYKGGGVADEVELYVDVKPVVMVGLEKVSTQQSQLSELCEVSVRGMLISSPGPPGEITSSAPNIVRLDLSQNALLADWEVVSEIALQLKHLTTLQLSENKHLRVPANPQPHTSSFLALRALYLNKMALTWNKVSVILEMTPQLEELHVCENRISNISNAEAIPQKLRLLNLEENELSDWTDVLRLKSLTKLQMLILNDNKFDNISFEGHSAGDFNSLECLCLCRNAITQWCSVDALAVLSSLADLKFKDNPLNRAEDVFVMRQLLISRLASLKTLNNSTVTSKERVVAERHYLKKYAPELEACKSSDALSRFHQSHSRFSHLASEHGLPGDGDEHGKESAGSAVGAITSALKDSLISVTIRCPHDPSRKELVKRIPLTMTVQKLKGLLHRLYKVGTSQQKLSYISRKSKCEIELEDNLRQISFYSIEDGDTVLMRC